MNHALPSQGIRLQKVLAHAGVASRRMAEKLIQDGCVEVDGHIITTLGTRVDPQRAVIKVHGSRIITNHDRAYFAFNKPDGVHCTMSDDHGRKCVGDYIRHRIRGSKALFHVGRLDAHTTGLLLLTNDGELAHRLMHPSYHVLKTYLAVVSGTVPRHLGKSLREGIMLDDGVAQVDRFTIRDELPGKTLLELQVHEGRKHIVRRILSAAGYPVIQLVRTHIGELSLGEQRPGSIRVLTSKEIASLYQAVGL